MGYFLKDKDMDALFQSFKGEYEIYAPMNYEKGGLYADTDRVRYGKPGAFSDIVWEKKAEYSMKEVLLPITQILFYYTEDNVKEPATTGKKAMVFLRSCDLHGLQRLDEIYLNNGAEDPYYKALRERVVFVHMACGESFENCFCASMGTNEPQSYDASVTREQDGFYLEVESLELARYLVKAEEKGAVMEKREGSPAYVKENPVQVTPPNPKGMNAQMLTHSFWGEYTGRCIACGRCNFVCPTCTCFIMQDIAYKENGRAGERRRVWASCQVDGYTDMAGGHSFRREEGQRMRFKVLHKMYDFKERFGYHMCVGCGRCDDICPEYISFSLCVNQLAKLTESEVR